METIPSLQPGCRPSLPLQSLRRRLPALALVAAVAVPALASAQMTGYTAATLDPTRSQVALHLERTIHQPLPEQYIWVAGSKGHAATAATSAGRSPQPHYYFRRTFTVGSVPAAATLYVAGPGTLKVFVNGQLAGTDAVAPNTNLGIRTMSFEVAHLLKPGSNTIALDATEGPHKGFGSDDPAALALEQGRVLVVKLLPAILGKNAKPLLLSDGSWKGGADAAQGWRQPRFNDNQWSKVVSYGGIESDIEFYQANSDSGLYDWPGYNGISPFLAEYTLGPAKVLQVADGVGTITGADSLTSPASATDSGTNPDSADLSVTLPGRDALLPRAPQVLLDFGREVVGRLRLSLRAISPPTWSSSMARAKTRPCRVPISARTPSISRPMPPPTVPRARFAMRWCALFAESTSSTARSISTASPIRSSGRARFSPLTPC